MKTKKKFIIPVVIILVIIVCILSLQGSPTKETKRSLKDEALENIKDFSSLIVDGGTIDKLKKVSGIKDIEETYLLTGIDSYIQKKPNDNVIKENKLEMYVQKNEELTKTLEKKIKDNFDYKLDETLVDKNFVSFVIDYKSYYYSIYWLDLKEIQKRLLASEETDEISEYKAKIKAMEILNSKLDNYINKDSRKTFGFIYKGLDDEETQNAFNSYLLNVAGFTYNEDTYMKKLNTSRKERIDGYITEAIKQGLITKDNVLAI